MAPKPEIYGRLGVHRRRPERWAIIRADGKPQVWLQRLVEVTRDELAVSLARGLAVNGLVLLDDNTIVRVADLDGGASPIGQTAS